jgi:hypothetical protein
VDVPAELEKLRVENPAITLQGALRELYRRRPEIFVPVESPNEPLPIPETGVLQVPMIGSIHHGHWRTELRAMKHHPTSAKLDRERRKALRRAKKIERRHHKEKQNK